MPSKQISQETFDDAVKENMEDFDMSKEEALEDAITQFKTQGIDLSTINLTGNPIDTSPKNQVISILNQLENQNQNENQEILQILNELIKYFQEHPSMKSIAGENNAVNILQTFQQHEDDEIKQFAFRAFMNLVYDHRQNQNFVRLNNMKILVEMYQQHTQQLDLMSYALGCIRVACLKNEENKKAFLSCLGLPLLVEQLEKCKEHELYAKQMSGLLRTLTLQDDPTQDFSQTHDIVRELSEFDLFSSCQPILQQYFSSPETLYSWFILLKQCCITEKTCQQLIDIGVLSDLQEMIQYHSNHISLLRAFIGIIRNMAASDSIKKLLIKNGSISIILKSMKTHVHEVLIQEHASATIAAIALRHPENCHLLIEQDAATLLTQALVLHQQSDSCVRQISLAIRNLVARTPELRDHFLNETLESILTDAQKRRGCGDEAYAALRDLGCSIQLYERKGKCNFNPTMKQSKELNENVKLASKAPFTQ